MNNVSVQTPQVAAAQLTGPRAAKQNTPVGLDAGEASFLQLLSSVLGTGAEASLAAQLKKNAEMLGAQINAEMLTINPLLTMMLSGQAGPDAGQQALALDLPAQAQSSAPIGDAALSAELLSQLQGVTGAAPAPVAANTHSFQSLAAALDVIDGDANMEVVTAAHSGSAEGRALALQGQSQFKRAVSQAQQMIKTTGNDDMVDEAELDLEALQKKVDSGAFLPNLSGTSKTGAPLIAEAGSTPDAQEQEIFAQIKASVTRHAEDGATDFTIKLRPEGLGEITVKLLETGGKVTLSLAASDANVQRLLGSELNNLRDIMRPYNVEVSQVVQTNEAQGMSMQQQFSQQFSQHSYTGQQQNPSFAYDPDYGESAKTGEPAQAAVPPDSVLDAYI